MAVPDIELICEMMLIAEQFIATRLLAKKLINLYILCRELLPKQVRVCLGFFVPYVLTNTESLGNSVAGHRIIIDIFYLYSIIFYFEDTLNHMSILTKLLNINLEESPISSDLRTFVMH